MGTEQYGFVYNAHDTDHYRCDHYRVKWLGDGILYANANNKARQKVDPFIGQWEIERQVRKPEDAAVINNLRSQYENIQKADAWATPELRSFINSAIRQLGDMGYVVDKFDNYAYQGFSNARVIRRVGRNHKFTLNPKKRNIPISYEMSNPSRVGGSDLLNAAYQSTGANPGQSYSPVAVVGPSSAQKMEMAGPTSAGATVNPGTVTTQSAGKDYDILNPTTANRQQAYLNELLSGQRSSLDQYVQQAALAGIQRGGVGSNLASGPSSSAQLQRESIANLASGYESRFKDSTDYLKNYADLQNQAYGRQTQADMQTQDLATKAGMQTQQLGFTGQETYADRMAKEALQRQQLNFTGSESAASRAAQAALQSQNLNQQSNQANMTQAYNTWAKQGDLDMQLQQIQAQNAQKSGELANQMNIAKMNPELLKLLNSGWNVGLGVNPAIKDAMQAIGFNY